MREQQVKVGDMVAWDEAPSVALVRDKDGDFALRVGGAGHFVATPSQIDDGGWESWDEMGAHHDAWSWGDLFGTVTIIALDVPAGATADDLRALAERFEIRDHLIRTGDDSIWYGEDIDDLVPHLHAAGWRPGMTAEDAARLLADHGSVSVNPGATSTFPET